MRATVTQIFFKKKKGEEKKLLLRYKKVMLPISVQEEQWEAEEIPLKSILYTSIRRGSHLSRGKWNKQPFCLFVVI